MIHNLHGSLCIDGRRWLPFVLARKRIGDAAKKDKRLFIEGGIMDKHGQGAKAGPKHR